MGNVESQRSAALDRLGVEYAAGRLRTGSLEFRVADALRATSEAGLRLALWGLLDHRRLVRRWHQAQDAVLGGPVGFVVLGAPPLKLTPSSERQIWTVGRSSRSNVRLEDTSVSRHHANVAFRGGCWTVEDLGSSNGTYVNGTRISRCTLRPGDQVAFGHTSASLTRSRRVIRRTARPEA